MNRTRAGGIAAGLMAVGLVIGFAGTAVAGDGVTETDCPAAMHEHMASQGMAGHMSSQGMAGMMSMMGGGPMGPGMMAPDATPGSL